MRIRVSPSSLCVAFLAVSCNESAPVDPQPRAGARVLAISTYPRFEPPPATLADTLAVFQEAVDLVHQAGSRGAFLSYTWSRLEARAGALNVSDVKRDIDNERARSPTTLLGIQVLNTTAKETPSDLRNASFADAAVQQRFRAVVDALQPQLGRDVAYLSIGNEVDIYLNTHPVEWSAYQTFYDSAVAYVHRVAPNVKVGVTGTFDGATGANANKLATLNAKSDVWILTYYPTGANNAVRAPEVAAQEIPQMRALAGDKKLVLQEVGYPSAELLTSSEAKQSVFFAQVFAAWERIGGDIPFLNIFLLHDLTKATCDLLGQYYGLPDAPEFKAFLCSLGLRRATGQPKQAWQTVLNAGAALQAQTR